VNIENLKPEDVLPPPPPPPPAPEQMVERVQFIAPVVVDDSAATGFGISDDFNNIPSQPPSVGSDIEVVPDQNQQPSVLEEPKKEAIFTVVEEQPSFPGGEEFRIAFLQQNIKYPEEAKELGIQGRVFVTYVVEADGSITDIRVLRGIGGGCDEEAIRVVSIMPKWIPGKQRGTPVRVQFNLPIKFTLQ
jgi:protein TonB